MDDLWIIVSATLGVVIVLGSGYAGLWLWYQYMREQRAPRRGRVARRR